MPGNLKIDSGRQYRLLPLAPLVLDPRCTTSIVCRNAFMSVQPYDLVGLAESRSQLAILLHGHLELHESRTLSLLGPSSASGMFVSVYDLLLQVAWTCPRTLWVCIIILLQGLARHFTWCLFLPPTLNIGFCPHTCPRGGAACAIAWTYCTIVSCYGPLQTGSHWGTSMWAGLVFLGVEYAVSTNSRGLPGIVLSSWRWELLDATICHLLWKQCPATWALNILLIWQVFSSL